MARIVARGQTPKGGRRPATFANLAQDIAPLAEFFAQNRQRQRAEELTKLVAAGATPAPVGGAPAGTPGSATLPSGAVTPGPAAAPAQPGRASMSPASRLMGQIGQPAFQEMVTEMMIANPKAFSDPANLMAFLTEPGSETMKVGKGESVISLEQTPGGGTAAKEIFRGKGDMVTTELRIGDTVFNMVHRDGEDPRTGKNIGMFNPLSPTQRLATSTFLFDDGHKEEVSGTDPNAFQKIQDIIRRGGKQISQSIQAEGAEGLLPGKVELRQARQIETQVRNFMDSSNQLLALIQDRPESLGVAGNVAEAANFLAATAEGLIKLTYDSAEVRDDPAAFLIEQDGERKASTRSEVEARVTEAMGDNFFAQLADRMRRATRNEAINTNRIKSLVVSLAFSAAAAAGQTGRGVSDKDVERFIQQIGVSADPLSFARVLEDMQMRMFGTYRNTLTTLNRTLPVEQQLLVDESIMENVRRAKVNRGGGVTTERPGDVTDPAVLETSRQRAGVPENWILGPVTNDWIYARPPNGTEVPGPEAWRKFPNKR